MEDALPPSGGEIHGSNDPVTASKEVTMPPSTDASTNPDVTEDGHDMLRKVAQDASSQAVEDPMISAHQQEREPTVDALERQARVSRQAESTATSMEALPAGDASLQNGSAPKGDSFEALSLYTSQNHCNQLTLPNGSSNWTQADLEALINDPPTEAPTSPVESEAPRIQAFAKLEFDDGEFYMNTYSVELGRDIRAARQAYERDVHALQQVNAKLRKRSSSSGEVSHTSSKAKKEHGRHLSGSVISESGGIIGLDHSDSDGARQRRGKKAKSATSSSQQLSRKSSMNFPGTRTDYQSLAMASLFDSSADTQLVDSHNSLPSPESCPLVPIHPPASIDGAPTSHKSISRKHVKIAFNFEKHLFEVIVLGRNGAFVDEEWYPEGDVQPLRSGSLIQIGGVGIRFLLPDVALGETGAENTQGSDPASFDMENGNAINGGIGDTDDDDGRDDEDEDEDVNGSGDDSDENDNDESDESNEPSEEERRGRPRKRERQVKPTPANRPVRNRKPVRGKEPMKTREPAKAKQSAKARLNLTTRKEPSPDPVTPPPKRKGPGRPPKNGIISKREQALLARQAREAAKAAARNTSDAPAGRGKGKSIPQPPKVTQENSNLQPNGKRKYKKRKTKAEIEAGEQENNVRESTEHTDSLPPDQNAAPPPKPPKPVKPPKPPRSPSPVFDEAQMTAEQLAKPQSSYVVLIHEALSGSKTGQMSLPQIYRAIERKYPFYKLRVQTTGWQSSVRHNLSQHPAFRKIERDGKGWMWGLVPEVSIEKEKKRRMTPPPMPAGGYYPSPQMIQPPYPYSGMPPPNSHMSYPPYASYPGPPRAYPPPAHFPPPVTASSLPPALANAQVDTSSTYQSPYATASSQPNAEASYSHPQQPATNGTNGTRSSPLNDAPKTSTPTETRPPPPPSSSHPLMNIANRIPTPIQISSHQTTPDTIMSHTTTHTPEELGVVKKFKNYLLSSLCDNPDAENLINSAINGVLEPSTVTHDGDDHQVIGIRNILQDMLDKMRAKAKEGTDGAAVEGKEGKTFAQILESVGVRNDDGVLPLPVTSKSPLLPPRTQAPPESHVCSPPQAREAVDGHGSVREDSGGKATTQEASIPAPTHAPVEERSSRKRPLDDEVDSPMDARPQGAKRIAT
ncbi:MAG: hypothetical protein Q9207_006559 [Kuettlingeria erythrocarpa]